MLNTLLELLGVGLIVAAAYLVALPLGLFVFGVSLVLLSNISDAEDDS